MDVVFLTLIMPSLLLILGSKILKLSGYSSLTPYKISIPIFIYVLIFTIYNSPKFEIIILVALVTLMSLLIKNFYNTNWKKTIFFTLFVILSEILLFILYDQIEGLIHIDYEYVNITIILAGTILIFSFLLTAGSKILNLYNSNFKLSFKVSIPLTVLFYVFYDDLETIHFVIGLLLLGLLIKFFYKIDWKTTLYLTLFVTLSGLLTTLIWVQINNHFFNTDYDI